MTFISAIERMKGTISKLEDWHGFIVPDDGTARIFFFHNAMDSFGPKFKELGEGQRVEFTRIQSQKGPRAIEVKVVE